MNKPTKPNITIPESFAENGIKTDFDNEKLTNGFDRLQPDVLAGDNLNKLIDDTYKGLNYAIAGTDAINLINEGETLTVQNGQLVSSRIGEQLANKADIDLNNLSSTGVEKFDGEWIDAGYTIIFLNRALSTSNASIEFLLDFLPDDNIYEVIFNIGITLAYPNNYCYGSVGLSTDIISSSFPAYRNSGSAAAGNIYTTATIIIPVKNKKIYLSGDSQNRYSTANLIAIAYRKLGTGFEATTQNEGI